MRKPGGRGIVGYQSPVYTIVRTAAELLDFVRSERNLHSIYELCLASHLHVIFFVVVALLHMREPIVSHELDPIRRHNIKEWSLLIITIRIL